MDSVADMIPLPRPTPTLKQTSVPPKYMTSSVGCQDFRGTAHEYEDSALVLEATKEDRIWRHTNYTAPVLMSNSLAADGPRSFSRLLLRSTVIRIDQCYSNFSIRLPFLSEVFNSHDSIDELRPSALLGHLHVHDSGKPTPG